MLLFSFLSLLLSNWAKKAWNRVARFAITEFYLPTKDVFFSAREDRMAKTWLLAQVSGDSIPSAADFFRFLSHSSALTLTIFSLKCIFLTWTLLTTACSFKVPEIIATCSLSSRYTTQWRETLCGPLFRECSAIVYREISQVKLTLEEMACWVNPRPY